MKLFALVPNDAAYYLHLHRSFISNQKRRIQEKELAAIRATKEREQQEMALYAKQYMASLCPKFIVE